MGSVVPFTRVPKIITAQLMGDTEGFFFATPPSASALGEALTKDAGQLSVLPDKWVTILIEGFELLMQKDWRYDTPDFDLSVLPAAHDVLAAGGITLADYCELWKPQRPTPAHPQRRAILVKLGESLLAAG